MVTGVILQENGVEYLDCYPANLPLRSIHCEKDNAKVLGFEWATPVSDNGVTVTGFKYEQATGSTPPAADALKVMVVQEHREQGRYIKVVVPNNYTISDFTEACCTACEALPSVTIPEPVINPSFCVPQEQACVPCATVIFVDALNAGMDTYTAKAYCKDANGNVIAASPATSTGASVAALVTAMNTNWASEFGATFSAVGNKVTAVTTLCYNFTLEITQSDAP